MIFYPSSYLAIAGGRLDLSKVAFRPKPRKYWSNGVVRNSRSRKYWSNGVVRTLVHFEFLQNLIKVHFPKIISLDFDILNFKILVFAYID